MIDTLSITGQGRFYKFQPDFTQLIAYKNQDGTERVPKFQYENQKGRYVAMYTPATDVMTVQINVHKLIFLDNVYNYETSPTILDELCFLFANYFFGDSLCYIARCDIGGVYTYTDYPETVRNLEHFRKARFPGARVNKFKHQNYKDSVFYFTRNWSIKIYNKGMEYAKKYHPQLDGQFGSDCGFNLYHTLRFEKTYRFNEMKRLGMPVVPYRGVPLNEFSTLALLEDFYEVFRNWEFDAIPHVAFGKSSTGLLSVIDNAGLLSEVQAQKLVSPSTISRYKAAKRKLAAEYYQPVAVNFRRNLPEKKLRMLRNVRKFGVHSLFT